MDNNLFNIDMTLFEEECGDCEKLSIRISCLPYEPKLCEPSWFFHDDIGSEDKLQTIKHQAEYYYYIEDYSSSLRAYDDYLSQCQDDQTFDVQEGRARCHSKLGLISESVSVAHEMYSKSMTERHKVSSLNLLVSCYEAAEPPLTGDQLMEATCCLQQLVTVFGNNAALWIKLAELYRTGSLSAANVMEFTSEVGAANSDTTCDISSSCIVCMWKTKHAEIIPHDIKAYLCYLRAHWLLKQHLALSEREEKQLRSASHRLDLCEVCENCSGVCKDNMKHGTTAIETSDKHKLLNVKDYKLSQDFTDNFDVSTFHDVLSSNKYVDHADVIK